MTLDDTISEIEECWKPLEKKEAQPASDTKRLMKRLCRMLNKQGFGGNNVQFPLKTWVEWIEVINPDAPSFPGGTRSNSATSVSSPKDSPEIVIQSLCKAVRELWNEYCAANRSTTGFMEDGPVSRKVASILEGKEP